MRNTDLILVIISFVIGFYMGNPKYDFDNNVITKLQQDATNNYRSDREQINFIITNYYSEDKK